jgi:hypothetical protein
VVFSKPTLFAVSFSTRDDQLSKPIDKKLFQKLTIYCIEIMPSRRTIIASLGGAASIGVGTRLWLTPRSATGYVQLKSIEARYRAGHQSHSKPIINVHPSGTSSSDTSRYHWVNDDWQGEFESPANPVVSEPLHQKLQQAYEEIQYHVGVCSPAWGDKEQKRGCHNGLATREEFNKVQLYDEVTASQAGTEITIHSVKGTWSFDDWP